MIGIINYFTTWSTLRGNHLSDCFENWFFSFILLSGRETAVKIRFRAFHVFFDSSKMKELLKWLCNYRQIIIILFLFFFYFTQSANYLPASTFLESIYFDFLAAMINWLRLLQGLLTTHRFRLVFSPESFAKRVKALFFYLCPFPALPPFLLQLYTVLPPLIPTKIVLMS